MAELFRLRIASGMVLLPPRLISRLGVADGDELRVLINDDDSVNLTVSRGMEACAPSAADMKEIEKRKRSRIPQEGVEEFVRKFRLKSHRAHGY